MPETMIRPARGIALSALAGLALAMAGCGGGGNPFGNPPDVANPTSVGGQKLSFAYFQRCINPILLAKLPVLQGSAGSTNTCANCHDNVTGTGGALRVVPGASLVDLPGLASTPEAIRATDMYKNYYSAQGSTVVGVPTESRLLTKPLLMNVLHGGGLIFANEQDANARLIEYWITHPMPKGQDEFSAAAGALFTPADAETGTCNSQ
jgi:hypothetical protein